MYSLPALNLFYGIPKMHPVAHWKFTHPHSLTEIKYQKEEKYWQARKNGTWAVLSLYCTLTARHTVALQLSHGFCFSHMLQTCSWPISALSSFLLLLALQLQAATQRFYKARVNTIAFFCSRLYNAPSRKSFQNRLMYWAVVAAAASWQLALVHVFPVVKVNLHSIIGTPGFKSD